MSFGWAGAGAAASDELQQILAQKFAEAQAREAAQLRERQMTLQEQTQQHNASMDMERLGVEATRANELRTERQRNQRLQEAQIALQQADLMSVPGLGTELPPEIAGLVAGTPYGVRVEQKTTLPSWRMDAQSGAKTESGGRAYATLAQTGEQAREAAQRAARLQFAADPQTPALVGRWLKARDAGLPIPNPESLETEAERAARQQGESDRAFSDFQRRSRFTRSLQPPAASQRGGLTEADLLDLQRDAHTRAVADYRAMSIDGLAPTDEQGRPITLEQLTQSYIDEGLRFLDALGQATTTQGGRRVVDFGQLRRRPSTPMPNDATPMPNDAALPPGGGRGVGAGPQVGAAQQPAGFLVPRQPGRSGSTTVQTPQGPISFPSAEAAEAFKRAAGL